MTPEQRIKELENRLIILTKELADVKNYTSNLGGSLEFKTLVQKYVDEESGSSARSFKSVAITDSLGLFGKTPIGQQSSIADPTGGTTVDSQARTAINSILDVLDNFGFTA